MAITSTGNLKEDLVNAMYKNASGKSNMNEYAEDLSDAIKNFLTRQEFRVVKLESEIDVEHIRTTEGLSIDISPDTLWGPYAPLVNLIKKVPGAGAIMDSAEGRIMAVIRKVSDGGGTLSKFNLKSGGDGGELDVKGVSSIDTIYNGRKTAEGLSMKSAVVLFEDEIKDDIKK